MSIDALLARRTSRSPDLATENHALTALAAAMAGDPGVFLEKVVETACRLCRAESAGISIAESGNALRLHVVAGRAAHLTNQRVARHGSPCGLALDRDRPTLVVEPARELTLPDLDLPVTEVMVIPWRLNGEPAGTLWGFKHRSGQEFDAEDARLLTTLARFASAGWALARSSVSGGGPGRRHERSSDTSASSFEGLSWQERVRDLTAANAALRAEVAERRRAEELARAAEEELRAAHQALSSGRARVRALEAHIADRTSDLARANAALRVEALEREAAVSARTELARRLATAQEDERRRFARDLHDSIGQSVAALALGIEAVASTGPLPQPTLAALGEIRRVADGLGREVHELAFQLRPTALDDLGLHAALAQHIASWSTRSGIEVDFHSTHVELGRLPPEFETVVYRVVQEALTNVVKHAQARHVSVVVERHDGRAIAIVEDDGRGFETNSPPSDRRLGLVGMRERVTLAGGTLDIESEPGHGTVVIVRIPLPRESASDATL
jgi:signal transduction histidine kinase